MSSKPSTQVEAAPDRSKRKLGRGLGALLGETQREESIAPAEGGTTAEAVQGGDATAVKTGLALVPVARIEPLPGQPRKHFDYDAL